MPAAPSASEVGWWRPGATAYDVEVMLAQHTGIVEIYLGNVAFSRVELASEVVARTETAKEVNGLKRLYGLIGEGEQRDLAYAIDMAAVGQPLQSHLSARLTRVGSPYARCGWLLRAGSVGRATRWASTGSLSSA